MSSPTNPKKRPHTPSVSSPGGPTTPNASTSKRRKHSSALSTTSSYPKQQKHPLRQTSFPPAGDEVQFTVRSPSVESSVAGTGSLLAGRGRQRGGPRSTPGAGSVRAGATPTLVNSGTGSVTGTAGGDEEDEEDEPDGDGAVWLEEPGKANAVQDKKREGILLDAFNDDQSDRYAAYKRLKLQLPVLKRIANQTLSQSIPPQVAISLAGLTKVFAGEIVEKARDVQDQWIRAERGLKPGDKLDDDSKGPLLPDHLREAVRLYKKDQEGGGIGFRGLSLNAKENYAGGRVRRLFK